MKVKFKGTGLRGWFTEGALYEVYYDEGILERDLCIKDEQGVRWWYPRETTDLEGKGYIVEIKTPRMEENE